LGVSTKILRGWDAYEGPARQPKFQSLKYTLGLRKRVPSSIAALSPTTSFGEQVDREGRAMSQSEQTPAFDPEEHQEAGLGDFSPEEVDALTQQVAAEHGKPEEAEVEDEPLDEDELLTVSEEGSE
jgi:hypothetical protein